MLVHFVWKLWMIFLSVCSFPALNKLKIPFNIWCSIHIQDLKWKSILSRQKDFPKVCDRKRRSNENPRVSQGQRRCGGVERPRHWSKKTATSHFLQQENEHTSPPPKNTQSYLAPPHQRPDKWEKLKNRERIWLLTRKYVSFRWGRTVRRWDALWDGETHCETVETHCETVEMHCETVRCSVRESGSAEFDR